MSKNKPSTSSAPRPAPKQMPRTTQASKPVTHQGKVNTGKMAVQKGWSGKK